VVEYGPLPTRTGAKEKEMIWPSNRMLGYEREALPVFLMLPTEEEPKEEEEIDGD